jgi:hypothetical protein
VNSFFLDQGRDGGAKWGWPLMEDSPHRLFDEAILVVRLYEVWRWL